MSGWMATSQLSESLGLCAVNAVDLAASEQAAARPWSAPATRQRFDPTKYVREQQQRERLLAARFGRRPVTPGVSSRRTSTRSAGRPESTASGVASRLCPSKLRCELLSDIIVPDTRPQHPPFYARWLLCCCVAGAQQPYTRPSSPSLALEHLKARLQGTMRQTRTFSDSKVKPAEGHSVPRQRQRPQARERPEMYRQDRQQQSNLEHDAARDMVDIDSRLLALQNFLMNAKSLT